MTEQSYAAHPTVRVAHLSVADLARRWGVADITVRRLQRSGELEAIRIGSQLRFSEATVADFEERHREAVEFP